jgi:cyanophycinase-like exopeptidase
MMIKGTLALAGSGEYLPPMEQVDRTLMGKIDGPVKVACLPTGAGTEGDQVIKYWSNLGVDHFTKLGAQATAVPVIDRASAMSEDHADQIYQSNFVYLSGGRPDYLYRTLVDTPVFEAIEHVMNSGGVVAGCSAGAMIWGARATPLPWHNGFNRLPGVVILPHFDEMSGWLVDTVKIVLAANLTVIGIDGNTALVCSNGSYQVAGSGGVMVWNKTQKRRYTDGESVKWA